MRLDRVFVDSNVLISGIAFRGNEFALLELARTGAIRLVIAEIVLDEVRDVVSRRFPKLRDDLERLLRSVDYESVALPHRGAVLSVSSVVRDPKDAAVLASVLAAKPDVAITGGKDLLTEEVRARAPWRDAWTICSHSCGSNESLTTEN